MKKSKIIAALMTAVTMASMLTATASATFVPKNETPVFDLTPTVEGRVRHIWEESEDEKGIINDYYNYVDENDELVTGYKLLYVDYGEGMVGADMRMVYTDEKTGEIKGRYTGFTGSKSGRRYYVTGERIYGWYKVGNYWYHFDEKGYADTGRTKICGAYYTFDEKGRWTGKVSRNGVAPKDFTLEWNLMGGQSFNTDGNILYGEGWEGEYGGDMKRYEKDVKFSARDRQVMYCMFLESGFSEGESYNFDSEYMDVIMDKYDGQVGELEMYISEHPTTYIITVTMNGKTTKIRYCADVSQINHLDKDCFSAYCLGRNLRDYRSNYLYKKFPVPENVEWDILR